MAGGLSGREAAKRFAVSPASVSRWRKREREEGSARPGPLGVDRRPARVEAHAPLILALMIETPDMTLATTPPHRRGPMPYTSNSNPH